MKDHPINIIGIDCAVDPANVGLALAVADQSGAWLLDATIGECHEGIVDQVAGWITSAEITLLALDAPLGWPRDMGTELAKHVAGQSISLDANLFFRRETDRKVRETLGVQSLDVGADRIARTALAALRLLADIRAKTALPIPLAWEPENVTTTQAIEVYPAATLAAHDLTHAGYKDADQGGERRKIIRALSRYLSWGEQTGVLADDTNVLDAALCVLAGVEFLNGEAVKPDDLDIAKREGWIWVRPDMVQYS
jgi:predicted RNase H-like nuclease